MGLIHLVGLLRAGDPVWNVGSGFRWRALQQENSGRVGFQSVAPQVTGVAFTNSLAVTKSLANQIYLNGSGVAAGDVDGDGLCDLYFCGMDGGNALYRNRGNWHFEEITTAAGVRCAGFDSTGATFVDLDGDGDLDLVVNTIGHGTRCFLNDGRGRFDDVTRAMGLEAPHGSMSLAFADVNGDGFLDLFVANYRRDTLRDHPNTRFRIQTVNGHPIVAMVDGRPASDPDLVGRYSFTPGAGVSENGEASILYLNQHGTNFTAMPFTGGLFLDEDGAFLKTPPYDWSLSVMFRDLNGDGLPDIYICNDFESPDRIWMNQGRGRFRAIAHKAIRHTSLFSMGVDVADINRDGFDDIFVADMLSRDYQRRQTQIGDSRNDPVSPDSGDKRLQYRMNTLLLNRGDGTYSDVAHFSGVDASEWSWTPIFLDVDLDGYEDLLVSNGHERDAQNVDIGGRLEAMRRSGKFTAQEIIDSRRQFPRLATPNVAFRNRGNLKFDDVSHEWGFDLSGVSQGMALADLDNDGDLDVIINNLNDAPFLLRNDASGPRVAVRLRGLPPNTAGIGARIRVIGGPVEQSQEMICGGRYLSGDEALRVFAAGTVSNRLRIEVVWRSGRKSLVSDVPANSICEISEQDSIPPGPVTRTANQPFFEDASGMLDHQSLSGVFDDIQRQPLLPRQLSQLGSGLAWFDLDGDGRDDLMVGNSKGGLLGIYRNLGGKGFELVQSPLTAKVLERTVTSMLGVPLRHESPRILLGQSNYEDGSSIDPAGQLSDLTGSNSVVAIPGQVSSTGPMAMTDLQGDGNLSLFVGGRVVPGKYPSPASSIVYDFKDGKFLPSAAQSPTLTHLGLASGAVFSDCNGDGYPDLIVSCEWGPIRVFLNENGSLKEATHSLGFDKFRGWWHGVATGDFDGDGRPDIVAANWGLNTLYHASSAHPIRAYYGDVTHNGVTDIVEAVYDEGMKRYVPVRDFGVLGSAMPFLRERFKTYTSFASVGIEEVFGTELASFSLVESETLESMVFLNRGDHFEAIPLPSEAQLAPALGVVVADYDGDGFQDVFLSQNWFAVRPGLDRSDSGVGLWLKGDGTGHFIPVSARESGVRMDAEQRGAAISDYDGDGRIDLAVTQNGAATKLYHNRRGQPALRVRLRAGETNPMGWGTALRGIYTSGEGPIVEVQAGSGCLSQNSAVLLVAKAGGLQKLWIRWPGGRSVTVAVPANANEVEITGDGALRVLR
jgi:hypothetical protein